MAQKKINISFPQAVALEMDEYCKKTDLARSVFVTLAVASYLSSQQLNSTLNRMCDILEKLPSGEATPNDLQELEKIQDTLRLLTARTE